MRLESAPSVGTPVGRSHRVFHKRGLEPHAKEQVAALPQHLPQTTPELTAGGCYRGAGGGDPAGGGGTPGGSGLEAGGGGGGGGAGDVYVGCDPRATGI